MCQKLSLNLWFFSQMFECWHCRCVLPCISAACIFFFWDSISLCCPGWPRIHYLAASQLARIASTSTTPSLRWGLDTVWTLPLLQSPGQPWAEQKLPLTETNTAYKVKPGLCPMAATSKDLILKQLCPLKCQLYMYSSLANIGIGFIILESIQMKESTDTEYLKFLVWLLS